jgi:serine/threonine-protein kinase PpkA
MTPALSSSTARYPGRGNAFRGQAIGRYADIAPQAPCVDGYRLKRRIGAGRMASAWLAEDVAGGREVVLKLLRREHARGGASFMQEFAVPFTIDSRHVVRVYRQFGGAGHAAIAMEYLSGGDLGALIRRGLSGDAALSLLRQAALALDATHRHGYAHGDVKPANLLLRACGELVLADFGMARPLGTVHAPSQPGIVVGTPRYAAPELSQAQPATAAADVYSLGVVLHEMLCGKPPFPGDTVMEVVCQHLVAPVPRLPAGLARFQPLVDAMLAKQPDHRPRDGQAVLDRIDLMQDAASSHPGPIGARK